MKKFFRLLKEQVDKFISTPLGITLVCSVLAVFSFYIADGRKVDPFFTGGVIFSSFAGLYILGAILGWLNKHKILRIQIKPIGKLFKSFWASEPRMVKLIARLILWSSFSIGIILGAIALLLGIFGGGSDLPCYNEYGNEETCLRDTPNTFMEDWDIKNKFLFYLIGGAISVAGAFVTYSLFFSGIFLCIHFIGVFLVWLLTGKWEFYPWDMKQK